MTFFLISESAFTVYNYNWRKNINQNPQKISLNQKKSAKILQFLPPVFSTWPPAARGGHTKFRAFRDCIPGKVLALCVCVCVCVYVSVMHSLRNFNWWWRNIDKDLKG